jgi:hypothetical protein
MKDKPIEMFGNTGEDLPIFSGVAQKAVVQDFKPQEAVVQPSMFAATCSVCFGTGWIKGKKKMIKCMYCNS